MATVSKKVTVNMLDKACQKFIEQLDIFLHPSGYCPFDLFARFYNEIPCLLINKKEKVVKEDEVILSNMPMFSHATTYNANYLLPSSMYYKGNMVSGLYPYYYNYNASTIRQINPNSDTHNVYGGHIFQELHISFPGVTHKKVEENKPELFQESSEDIKDYIQVFSALFLGILNLGGNTYDYSVDCYIKRKPTLVNLEKFLGRTLGNLLSKSKLRQMDEITGEEDSSLYPSTNFIDGYEISTGSLPIVLVGDEGEDGTEPKVVKVQKDLIYYNDSYYMAGVFKNKPDGNYTKEDYSILISSSLFAEEKFNHFSRIVTKYYLPLLMRLNPELKVEILSHDEIQKRLSTNNFITKTNSDVRRALLELA